MGEQLLKVHVKFFQHAQAAADSKFGNSPTSNPAGS